MLNIAFRTLQSWTVLNKVGLWGIGLMASSWDLSHLPWILQSLLPPWAKRLKDNKAGGAKGDSDTCRKVGRLWRGSESLCPEATGWTALCPPRRNKEGQRF